MTLNKQSRKVHILVVTENDPPLFDTTTKAIMNCMNGNPTIEIRSLAYGRQWCTWLIDGNVEECTRHKTSTGVTDKLEAWSDLLVIACASADTIAKMLQGITSDVLLNLLRSWDVSKPILLIPGMTKSMWENPMTKEQLRKIQKKWEWIRIMSPVLWSRDRNEKMKTMDWPCMDEIAATLNLLTDSIKTCHEAEPGTSSNNLVTTSDKNHIILPPEIWTLIFEQTGDWELAAALNMYTNLPIPIRWGLPLTTGHSMHLEWTILTGSYADTIKLLETSPSIECLSVISVELIIIFGRIDLLTYVESKYPLLFWSSFGNQTLPTKASLFGTVSILDWWYESVVFLERKYSNKTMNLASKAGFLHILEWWRVSGLQLHYSEAALEQASSDGNVEVLNWWLKASLDSCSYYVVEVDGGVQLSKPCSGNTSDADDFNLRYDCNARLKPLPLKPGKSLELAIKNNQGSVVKWWATSGIETGYERFAAYTASGYGNVQMLQLWKECVGKEMQFGEDILVQPTKRCHIQVLEWWKQSGYTVMYRREAIRNALASVHRMGQNGVEVKAWWTSNGLYFHPANSGPIMQYL